MLLTDSDPKDEANRLQAEHFCVELHCAIADLEPELENLKAALARQVGRRTSADRIRHTQKSMRDAIIKRRELTRMLEALGHRFPCRDHA